MDTTSHSKAQQTTIEPATVRTTPFRMRSVALGILCLMLAVLVLVVLQSKSVGSIINSFVPTYELEGEVFVADKYASSRKLSLVPVFLISDADLMPHLTKKVETANREMTRLKSDLNLTEGELRSTRDRMKLLRKREQDAYERVDRWFKDQIKAASPKSFARSEELNSLTNEFDEAHAKLLKTEEEELAPLESRYRQITEQEGYYTSAKFYFDSLPEPRERTKTDADGKFQFQIPLVGSYTIGAEVPDTHLAWLVRVRRDGKLQKKILLTNQNLFDVSNGKLICDP